MKKNTIIKSDTILQKEAELVQLEKTHKRLKTNLKRNRTILKNKVEN